MCLRVSLGTGNTTSRQTCPSPKSDMLEPLAILILLLRYPCQAVFYCFTKLLDILPVLQHMTMTVEAYSKRAKLNNNGIQQA